MPTSQGTSSIVNAVGGFSQKVPLPTQPQSNALSSYYPAINAVLIPIIYSTVSYTLVLPQGAFIFQVLFSPDVAFSTGAFSLGTTVGGTQLLNGISLTSGTINTLPVPILPGSTQIVYVTITGSPSSGSGNLVIAYFPTQVAPLAN